MRYSLKHASMLAMGLIMGFGIMAFTDILHPMTPFVPSSLVLNTADPLPETMHWVDPHYGFPTRNPTGLLEVRWYCAYEGLNSLTARQINPRLFAPLVPIEPPQRGGSDDDEAFYYELTRIQNDPCPVFRFDRDYPAQ